MDTNMEVHNVKHRVHVRLKARPQARERKHTWGVAHVSQLTVPTTLVSANLERCREVVVRVGVGIINIVGIGEDVRCERV